MNVIITTLGETMAVQNLPPDAIGDWELRREVCTGTVREMQREEEEEEKGRRE
jgi:hypothetical protein